MEERMRGNNRINARLLILALVFAGCFAAEIT